MAIALWKAKVPLKTIREQCNMSEKTLWRILTHACPGKEKREQEASGQHAQEAGGGYCKAECLHLVLRSLQIEKYEK